MGTRAETREQAVETLRRRNADLEVLYETVKDLSSTLSVDRVLERLLDRTLQHLDAEIGSILLLGDDDHLRVMVSHGLPPEVVERTEMKIGEGISGHVALHGEPLIVEDVEAHPTFRRRNRERKAALVAPGPFDLEFERLVEVAVICEPGEPIDLREA